MLTGYCCAGKSTVAEIFAEELHMQLPEELRRGIYTRHLGSPAYQILADYDPDYEKLLDLYLKSGAHDRRQSSIDFMKSQPGFREKLQGVVTALKQVFGDDILCRIVEHDLEPESVVTLLVPDVRRVKEIEFFAKLAASTEDSILVVKVVCKGAGPVNDHESESQYEQLASFSDYTINNDPGTTHLELLQQVKNIIAQERWLLSCNADMTEKEDHFRRYL